MSAPPPSYDQASGYPNQGYNQYPGFAPPYPPGPNQQGYPGQPGYPPAPSGYQQPPQTGFVPMMPPPIHGGPPGAGTISVETNRNEPKYDDHDRDHEAGAEWATDSFSDKAIRRSFIRKVYLILTVQLLVTCGGIAFFLLHTPTRIWVQEHSWIYWISYGVFLVTYIILICIPSVRRKTPGNYICLAVFTLAFTYMTAMISSYYTVESVLIAVAITAAVCIAITIFAIQTKIDFTMCYGLMFAAIMVLFLFGLTCLIVNFTTGFRHFHILKIVYGALGALVFSLFLVYDTQMLMGGRKVELSPEEYIYGATQLYLDVVYIFIFLLSIFGKSN